MAEVTATPPGRPRAAPLRDDAGDARLAQCAAQGDAEAFRALVVRHQSAVIALARTLLPCAADGEDVAQDAFVAAWRKLRTFDPSRGSFFGWLAAIARNRAFDVRSRRAPAPVANVPDRAAPAGGDALSEEDAHRALDRALAALPDEQRAAFVLAEVHGLPLAEVAAIEGVPVGTVKSRAARAREKLRAALTREEIEP